MWWTTEPPVPPIFAPTAAKHIDLPPTAVFLSVRGMIAAGIQKEEEGGGGKQPQGWVRGASPSFFSPRAVSLRGAAVKGGSGFVYLSIHSYDFVLGLSNSAIKGREAAGKSYRTSQTSNGPTACHAALFPLALPHC